MGRTRQGSPLSPKEEEEHVTRMEKLEEDERYLYGMGETSVCATPIFVVITGRGRMHIFGGGDKSRHLSGYSRNFFVRTQGRRESPTLFLFFPVVFPTKEKVEKKKENSLKEAKFV